ncbi:MAG: zinc-binding dehydrogenase [Clostridia bacterium]|nr:zinc-binding dehydrogenase [Clostridia bacterium]
MKDRQRAIAALEKGKLSEVEIAIPEPDDYEVLVKNEGCVFCNTTDKMIVDDLFRTPDYPVVIGHECFGKVIKVGKKVKKYKLGDRVICANAIVNGYDGKYYSSWGGFAEYGIAGDLEAYLAENGALDEKNAYRARYEANEIIPSDLSYEKACLAFPLAETASAVRQVGDLTGKTVVVIGTGIVGYFFTYLANIYGAKEVVVLGRRQSRLEVTKKIGASQTFIDVNEATEYLNSRGGADVVFECSGNYQALESGLPYLKAGGLFAVYAVPKQAYTFDLLKCPNTFLYQRIDPIVSEAIGEVCELLAADKVPVEVFLTHQWSFDEAPKAFEEVRKGNVIKGLVVIS